MEFSSKIQLSINSLSKTITKWWQLAIFVVAVITTTTIIIDYGFNLQPEEDALLKKVYNFSWWIYLISYISSFIFQWRNITKKKVIPTILWGTLLLSLGLEHIITLPHSLAWLNHQLFEIAVLGLFSLLEISRGVIGLINKRTNPSLLMATAFALIISVGTLLLMLPRSTHEGVSLSIIDSLFVSTSAVCITGLTPIDIAQVFTVEGQFIIIMLVQIGGLGVMTITSFFALFFMGGSGLYNQFALRDLVGSDTLSSLLSTLLYILTFTFVIEGIGALLIWLSIHGTLDMTLRQEIFFACFHAISAFCNAGFSTVPGHVGNPEFMQGHNFFFLILSLLIVFGGLGFPILMNFKRIVFYHLKNGIQRLLGKKGNNKVIHLTQLNTRIVLTATVYLLSITTILIAIIEWNGALKELPFIDKIVHSIFNAVSPRSSGFSSIDLTHFSFITIVLYMVLMWIGGGSQSTAGGIKINTFVVSIASFLSVVKGRSNVVLFNRELSENSIRRASAVIVSSIFCILFFFILLMILEPNLSHKGLLFETVSAFSTVGSSLNITPQLGNLSKLLVALIMFVGRVGFITLLMSFVKLDMQSRIRYPKDNVIIN
jgi:Trk-type K+ transport system membrane component